MAAWFAAFRGNFPLCAEGPSLHSADAVILGRPLKAMTMLQAHLLTIRIMAGIIQRMHRLQRSAGGLAGIVVLCGLAGCGIGPATVTRDRFDYTETIASSWK